MPRKKPTPELTNTLLQEQREAIDSVFPRERTYADLSDDELISLFAIAFDYEGDFTDAFNPAIHKVKREGDRIQFTNQKCEQIVLWSDDGSVAKYVLSHNESLSNPFAFVRKCWALGLKY